MKLFRSAQTMKTVIAIASVAVGILPSRHAAESQIETSAIVPEYFSRC
jgi:hypothetical protein